MEANGQAKPVPSREQLRDAKLRNALLRESLEYKRLAQIEKTAGLLESYIDEDFLGGWSGAGIGDYQERVRERYSMGITIATPHDRRAGNNAPSVRNEQELFQDIANSRWLIERNSFAQAILGNYVNYTVGKGFTYKFAPKKLLDQSDKPGQQVSDGVKRLMAQAQAWLDGWLKRQRWNQAPDHAGDTTLADPREQEIARRLKRDGGAFVRLFYEPEGETVPRFVEPELVRNPPGAMEADGWSFGGRHHVSENGAHDVERVIEWAIVYPEMQGSGHQPDKVPAAGPELAQADEIVHIKRRGVDATIKRGSPAFTGDTLQALERASKLQRNASVGSAIRAATALIWQHAVGTHAQVTALAAGLAERKETNPVTGALTNTERHLPGGILRVPKGQELVPQPTVPMAEYLQAGQGDQRQACGTFQMPEYMTGSTNDANYATAKEAGTPFVVATIAEQDHLKGGFLAVVWRAVKHAVRSEKLPAEVLDLLDLQCEASDPEQRNTLETAQEAQIRVASKLLSPQTAMMQAGLEPEEEMRNWQEFDDRFGQEQGLGLPDGMDDPLSGGGQHEGYKGKNGHFYPMKEALERLEVLLREVKDASGHEHAADGKFGVGGSKKTDSTDPHAQAEGVVKKKSLWQKIKGLPRTVVKKSVDLVKGMYARAEKKYGSKWAKAIAATAIITMPTPFTMASVAAMTGLAHLWTRYISKRPQLVGESRETEPTQAEIEAAAKEWAEQLIAAFADLEEAGDCYRESKDASGHEHDHLGHFAKTGDSGTPPGQMSKMAWDGLHRQAVGGSKFAAQTIAYHKSKMSKESPAPTGAGSLLQQHGPAFEKAFDKLDKGHNFVGLVDLRKETGLPKEDFDALVHELRKSGKFAASGYEGRHGLSQEQIDAGIREKPGPGQPVGTLLGFLSRKK